MSSKTVLVSVLLLLSLAAALPAVAADHIFGRSPWGLGVEYRHLELLHETSDRNQYGDIGLDVGALMVSYRYGRR